MNALLCGCHAIGDDGRIFSRLYQLSVKGIQGIKTLAGNDWKPLRPATTKSGYLQIALHGKSVRVNRLVASAFIPNPDNLPEAQHINGIRMDNRAANLKWGTQKDNAADRDRHGRTVMGDKNPKARLNAEKVRKIRELRKEGVSFQAIAHKFGVSKKLIMLVVQNKIWRWVE